MTVVLVALIPRVIAAVALGNGFHFPDEAVYADAARKLLGGDGFDATYLRVPGYPALLALLGAPAPASILWLRMAQAMVAALGAALVFLAADRLVGRTSAMAAAVIYALDPLLVVAAGLLYPEATAAVLMLAVVLLAWEAARRDSAVCAVLAGSSLGLLALFRPVALVVVPVLATWVLCARAARRALHAALIGLTCLLVLAPWTYRNYRVHGRLVPVSLAGTDSASTSRDARGHGGAIPLMSRMAREFGHFWELVPSRLQTDDPRLREVFHQVDRRFPTAPTFSRSLRDVVSAASFGVELLLALAGLVLLGRSRRREAILLASVILAFALGHTLFFGKLRYRITILPLVFLFAGAAAGALASALQRRAAARAPGPARSPP